MPSYKEFHRRSIDDREGFWSDEAKLVHWQKPFSKVLDYSRPPFARWFVGGETNLCHNAIDRHLAARGDQKALVWISTEVNAEKSYSYRELHAEVQRVASMMRALGVGKGDRVIVYMPMIPEACFAILACARIGAIHSVVFGGFAASSLAARIDDARPKLMITADGGSRSTAAVSTRICRSSPGAISTGMSWRRSTPGPTCPAPGSKRTSPRTSSIPLERPASPRACSGTSAATPWRSRPR